MSLSSIETWKWIASQLAALIIGGIAVLVTVILTMPTGLTEQQITAIIRTELSAMPRPVTMPEVRLVIAEEIAKIPDPTTERDVLEIMLANFPNMSRERGYYASSGQPRVEKLESRADALEAAMENCKEHAETNQRDFERVIDRMEKLIAKVDVQPVAEVHPARPFRNPIFR